MATPETSSEQLFDLKKGLWQRLNSETLQYMFTLDLWLMFIIALMIWLTLKGREESYKDVMVWAVVLGSLAPVWIGRLDVLIHRTVPAVVDIENGFGYVPVDQTQLPNIVEPVFRSWENWYKPRLKMGVKILAPLDLLAGIFLFALFMHANNAAYNGYLADISWRGYFWYSAILVHLIGWGIIAAAKPLSE